ncbi:MAG TPA: hypothetical protein PL183_06705 [Aquamicrobium sp.]|nr:hypothetical protein [Aquamicrobium sp.]
MSNAAGIEARDAGAEKRQREDPAALDDLPANGSRLGGRLRALAGMTERGSRLSLRSAGMTVGRSSLYAAVIPEAGA